MAIEMDYMKILTRFICFLSLIAGIHLGWLVAYSAEIDPYPTIEIPIFQGGHHLQKFFDSSQKTKSVTYRVLTSHRPTEVLEFYDAYFNGRGWRSTFETCQRHWEDLAEETKPAEPIVRQLFASWVNEEMNLKAALWIIYEVSNKKSQNEVVVSCRLQRKRVKMK